MKRYRKAYNKRYLVIALAVAAALAVGFMLGRTAPAPKHKPPAPVKKTAVKTPLVRKPALPVIKKNFTNPKIGIVIDDFGYNTNNIEKFLDIGRPITLAVLPDRRYSVKVAEIAHSRGYETILHLPLEPKGELVREEPGTIGSAMSDKEITSRLKEELASVPYIDGVSNHMGSKGTEDRRIMLLVFNELKNKKLFFFDSLTSANSVCGDIAKSSGVKYARRDVFLDISGAAADVEKRLLETRRLAFRKGYAIAIGHDKADTAAALAKLMPAMAAEGVEFVYISDLVK